MKKIRSSEITPESVYLSRRRFIKKGAQLVVGAVLLSGCGESSGPTATPAGRALPPPTAEATVLEPELATPSSSSGPLGRALTSYEVATGYNNFYEFSLGKEAVARIAEGFDTSPWKIEVGGLVNSPQVFDLDDLRALEVEERIYRMRCVEGWSMVIPWMGFPLSRLLNAVEPLSSARYVRFETLFDPERMPGTGQDFPWPYVEGLRIDEAMHDLTLLATGLYGRALPPQNGAPVRLVVPWKYGFKSVKSVVKIDLVEEMPTTFWMATSPSEYGFWANINPDVPHPRWSQATERVIGTNERIRTLFFNGYADEVADLYENLDTGKWYE